AGATWTTVNPTLTAAQREFRVSTADTDTVFAIDGDVLVRSDDSGATFAPSDTGIPAGQTLGRLRTTLADANVLVVADLQAPQLYRSDDGGQMWSAMNVAPGLASDNIVDVLIDPTDADHVWVSGGFGQRAAIYETADAGTTWDELADPTDSDGAGALVWTADGNAVSFARTGVVRLIDGELFEANAGYNEFEFDGLRVPGGDGAPLYGFSQTGGVVATAPVEPLWVNRRQTMGSNVNDLYVASADPLTLWAATAAGLFLSTDGGLLWTAMPVPGAAFQSAVSASGLAPDTVYALGATGLHVSTDGGLNWTLGLATDDFPAGGLRGMIVTSSANAETAFVPSNTSGLLRTTDAGQSWQTLAAPFDTQGVNDVVADPLSAGGLHVATDEAVWSSDDDGATWILRNPEQAFSVIFAIEADSVVKGRLYARDAGGLWSLDPLSGTWALLAPPPGPGGLIILGETLATDAVASGRLFDTQTSL
ncbi:MAG: hypothetical protein AAFU65_15770, partial [Pseudomonadota bacterium]